MRTLEVGFQALGANVTIKSGASCSGRHSYPASLQAGDALMFVGMGRSMETLPLARVGARGVRRVHYHTEPLQQTCLDVTATTLWD